MEGIQVRDVYLWIIRVKKDIYCPVYRRESPQILGQRDKGSVDVSVWGALQLKRERGGGAGETTNHQTGKRSSMLGEERFSKGKT